MNGMRRGFIREALVFSMWAPIYAVSVMVIMSTYSTSNEAQNLSQAMDILFLLGVIFFVGNIFIFFINKAFIKPWMDKQRLNNTKAIDTFFGFILGGTRFVVILFITVMIYDIFVSPFSLTGVPSSSYVKHAYEHSIPIKRWLIEEGYIDIEIVIYDKDYEEEKFEKEKLMEEFKGYRGIY